jgi:hypothetical protein
MSAGGSGEGEELFLLRSVEEGGGLCVGERPWRLNFDGFRRQEAEQQKPPRGLHDCLGVLGLPPQSVCLSICTAPSLYDLVLVSGASLTWVV